MNYRLQVKIRHVEVLDPEGNVIGELPPFAQDPQELIHMYEMLVLTRVLDKKAVSMFYEEHIGTYPSTLGEEAVDVGIGFAMNETEGNILVPYYRNLGTHLTIFGLDVFKDVLLYWGGDERGNIGLAHPDKSLPYTIPIGTQYPMGVGYAKGMRLQNKSGAVVITGGDASTSKGECSAAMNKAATQKLPVVFVCRNNYWGISTTLKEQTATFPLAMRSHGFMIPSVIVDGNDVIAVRQVVSEAIRHARAGKGPMFIEAQTYRIGPHTTVDQAKEYRDQSEVDAEWEKEPVRRLRSYLRDLGRWSETNEHELLESAQGSAARLAKLYLDEPPQKPQDMVSALFEKVPEVRSFRKQFAALRCKEE